MSLFKWPSRISRGAKTKCLFNTRSNQWFQPIQQHSSGSHRQHYIGCLYKESRGGEVGSSVYPSVENPDLVCQETCNSQGSTHPKSAECDSRQTIQTRPDHSNRIVPSPRGLPSHMLPVAPAPSRPVCHQVQHQTSIVCFTSSGPSGLGSGCS